MLNVQNKGKVLYEKCNVNGRKTFDAWDILLKFLNLFKKN